ncbi:MAG TPA: anthranilate synthase family protein [Mycobacteriales bacterium]|nr:anthranilate synthase family protein [Mycobacteriales bacterium]
MSAGDLLDRVLARPPAAFALLHRPDAYPVRMLDVLVGDATAVAAVADIPVPAAGGGHRDGVRFDVLAMLPYRQIGERGFACTDDGAPLIAMTVTGQDTVPVGEALARIPDRHLEVSPGRFDVSDDDYAEIVSRVVKEAIGEGDGSNFVVKRSVVVEIGDYDPLSAVAFFRRLLELESGAYWTFLVHTPERTFVGASPERHVTLHAGVATMNPISGTYRYPPAGPTLPDVLGFLADRKESDELYMVLDEELKMMTRICAPGVRVSGPRFKEMARLAHTEYFIEGRCDREVRDILRETLFAPTVTGSPLENACRVISRYEPHGRSYYSGVAALIGRDAAGGQVLDSAILIRTAEIDAAGRVEIGVGASLVRESRPEAEVAETRAKAGGLLAALQGGGPGRFGTHPDVRDALQGRNRTIAGFWLDGGPDGPDGPDGSGGSGGPDRPGAVPGLAGCRTLIVDAEDTFTSMLDHQLRSLDMAVTLRRYDESPALTGWDVVVLGPGPGDPRDLAHPKIAHLRAAVDTLLAARLPFVAVCLSHQVLCDRLGLALQRLDPPNQGLQREIDLFGRRERVGFYNTFAARSEHDRLDVAGVGPVEVCRDPGTGQVHALRGPGFASFQFHAESVLTQHGPRILAAAVRTAVSR